MIDFVFFSRLVALTLRDGELHRRQSCFFPSSWWKLLVWLHWSVWLLLFSYSAYSSCYFITINWCQQVPYPPQCLRCSFLPNLNLKSCWSREWDSCFVIWWSWPLNLSDNYINGNAFFFKLGNEYATIISTVSQCTNVNHINNITSHIHPANNTVYEVNIASSCVNNVNINALIL